jgi:hypothetical protein
VSMIHTPKNHWSGILQSLSSDIILWHLLTKRSDHSVFCINLGSHHVPHSGNVNRFHSQGWRRNASILWASLRGWYDIGVGE